MIILFDYNRTLFDPETHALYPDADEVLSLLAQNHTLHLISKKEVGRTETIESFGIKKYFASIHLVEQKTEELFSALTKTNKTVVIGDSISHEIRIGNILGAITIRIKQGIFASAEPQNDMEIASYTTSSLQEIPKIIDSL